MLLVTVVPFHNTEIVILPEVTLYPIGTSPITFPKFTVEEKAVPACNPFLVTDVPHGST